MYAVKRIWQADSRRHTLLAEQVKLCPFVLFPQRYEKTIVFGNSIIVFVATMAPTVAFAAVAELEREYILQRQREGIAIAKTKGKYTGRKPRPLPDNFERVVARWRAGEITAAEAMRQTGLKPNTFYRRCSQTSLALKRIKSI